LESWKVRLSEGGAPLLLHHCGYDETAVMMSDEMPLRLKSFPIPHEKTSFESYRARCFRPMSVLHPELHYVAFSHLLLR